MYVFDTNIFSQMFRFYYRLQFPSLWQRFDSLAKDGRITSTLEVKKELENFGKNEFKEELDRISHLFPPPTKQEFAFAQQIFDHKRFKQNIPDSYLLKGGAHADPFLIARAHLTNGTLVTNEKERADGVSIPNICNHFGINCIPFQVFMAREDWIF